MFEPTSRTPRRTGDHLTSDWGRSGVVEGEHVVLSTFRVVRLTHRFSPLGVALGRAATRSPCGQQKPVSTFERTSKHAAWLRLKSNAQAASQRFLSITSRPLRGLPDLRPTTRRDRPGKEAVFRPTAPVPPDQESTVHAASERNRATVRTSHRELRISHSPGPAGAVTRARLADPYSGNSDSERCGIRSRTCTRAPERSPGAAAPKGPPRSWSAVA